MLCTTEPPKEASALLAPGFSLGLPLLAANENVGSDRYFSVLNPIGALGTAERILEDPETLGSAERFPSRLAGPPRDSGSAEPSRYVR